MRRQLVLVFFSLFFVLGSVGCKNDPNKVEERVLGALENERTTTPLGVEVSDDFSVTLTGTVATEEQKRRIEDIVRHVPGVLRVDDELRVEAAPSK